MVGLMTNKLLWENGAQDPDFSKMHLFSFASFGRSTSFLQNDQVWASSYYSTAKVGQKGLRSMAIEAGPGG